MGLFNKWVFLFFTAIAGSGLTESDVLAACSGNLSAGYRIVELSSKLPSGQNVKIPAAMWYPTTAPAAPRSYGGFTSVYFGNLAVNADIARCDSFPVVVFSHGDFGCGIQSVFITEELARRGYIVIAPDHWDSSCSVTGGVGRALRAPAFPMNDPVENPSLVQPWNFTHDAHLDRYYDVEAALDYVLANPFGGAQQADPSRVGMMGHSLGGYTSAAMLGAWKKWKDPRFKSALLLSPYLNPFSPVANSAHLIEDSGLSNPMGQLALPVMFQTGTLDFGIAPFLMAPGGTYNNTNGGGDSASPVLANTYLANFAGPNHFTWTNLVCTFYGYTPTCLQQSTEAAAIVDASVLFLDAHLKGVAQPRLTQPNMGTSGNGMADYWWKTSYTSPNAAPGIADVSDR
jgi:hypothetical protein